ncbi:hypothetical protein C0Q92_14625 [Streptomyces albidoflavus]|uniref:Uncharacterized protein n=1 Tax=Streptomyces albidoflavus TaxID=1886 RepID=A0A8G2E0R5_9ACTN|nr:hypothetical protein C0Q92_14625 [Streptomyces albidoflavus]
MQPVNAARGSPWLRDEEAVCHHGASGGRRGCCQCRQKHADDRRAPALTRPRRAAYEQMPNP